MTLDRMNRTESAGRVMAAHDGCGKRSRSRQPFSMSSLSRVMPCRYFSLTPHVSRRVHAPLKTPLLSRLRKHPLADARGSVLEERKFSSSLGLVARRAMVTPLQSRLCLYPLADARGSVLEFSHRPWQGIAKDVIFFINVLRPVSHKTQLEIIIPVLQTSPSNRA